MNTNPNEFFKNWSENCYSGFNTARKLAQHQLNFAQEMFNQVVQYGQNWLELVKDATHNCSSACNTSKKENGKTQ